MIRSTLVLAAAALSFVSGVAPAREIVLTNDDGLTSNVVALYKALKAAGHDVIVSVPCTNQSGMGAAMYIAKPLPPLAADCLNAAAKAGAPGAGPMSAPGLAGDFFYVDGTPVMSLLYGLDIVAQKRWGHPPELVLSGPNQGQNLGAIVIGSGTVSNAEVAALRGIPAIALSAGANTTGTAQAPLANPLSAHVAKLAVKLVAALDTPGSSLLPPGLALNVNFPDQLEGAGWRATVPGTWNDLRMTFSENMATNVSPVMAKMAKSRGMTLPPLPGIVIDTNATPPTAQQGDDEAVVNKRDITVTPLQAGYAASAPKQRWVSDRLTPLLAAAPSPGPAPVSPSPSPQPR